MKSLNDLDDALSPEQLSNLLNRQKNLMHARSQNVEAMITDVANDVQPIDHPQQQMIMRDYDQKAQQSMDSEISGIGETDGKKRTGYDPSVEDTYHEF